MASDSGEEWPDLALRTIDFATHLDPARYPNDTTRKHAILLNKAETEFLTGKIDLAQEFFEQVLRDATEVELMASACLGLAWVSYTRSNWPGCQDRISEGFRFARSPETEAHLLALRGLLYYRMGSYDDSIRDCEAAIEMEPEGEAGALAYSTLGILQHARNNDELVLEHWATTQHLARELERPDFAVRALNNLGTYHYNHDALEQAQESFSKALDIGRMVHFQVFLGFPHINLAGVHMKLEEYDAARENLQQAERLFKLVQDKMMLGAVNIELQRICRLQGDHETAHKHLDIAERMILDSSSMRLLIFIYRERGQLYHDQEKWKEALGELRLARELANLLNEETLSKEIEGLQQECQDKDRVDN